MGFEEGACRACTCETSSIRTADVIPPGQKTHFTFFSGSPAAPCRAGQIGRRAVAAGFRFLPAVRWGEDVAVWSALYTPSAL